MEEEITPRYWNMEKASVMVGMRKNSFYQVAKRLKLGSKKGRNRMFTLKEIMEIAKTV